MGTTGAFFGLPSGHQVATPARDRGGRGTLDRQTTQPPSHCGQGAPGAQSGQKRQPQRVSWG